MAQAAPAQACPQKLFQPLRWDIVFRRLRWFICWIHKKTHESKTPIVHESVDSCLPHGRLMLFFDGAMEPILDALGFAHCRVSLINLVCWASNSYSLMHIYLPTRQHKWRTTPRHGVISAHLFCSHMCAVLSYLFIHQHVLIGSRRTDTNLTDSVHLQDMQGIPRAFACDSIG